MLATGFVVPALAAESCSRDVVCVITEDNGDTVDIYVHNRQSAEITVTLRADLTNMVASTPLPLIQTYPGQQKVRALTIARDKRFESWNYRPSYEWTWGTIDAAHDDNHLYSLPYAPGQAYRIDQGYDGRFSHFGEMKYAIDWNMPEGTPVYAARDGVVVGAQDQYTEGGPDRRYQNRVNYVMIKHVDGTIAEYAHLKPHGVQVAVGDEVRAGDLIALSGNTGFTTGPHLHFFVYKAVDGGRRQSFPVRFKIMDQPIQLVEGEAYQAVGSAVTADKPQAAPKTKKRSAPR